MAMTMRTRMSTWLVVESSGQQEEAAESLARRLPACTCNMRMQKDDDGCECGDDGDGGGGDVDGDNDQHLHCSGGGRVGRRDEGREVGGSGANFDVASIT